MRTERQTQASRANGAKSNGHATPEGKLASSRNATTHGVLSGTIVLEGESKDRALLATETSPVENKAAAAVHSLTQAVSRPHDQKAFIAKRSQQLVENTQTGRTKRGFFGRTRENQRTSPRNRYRKTKNVPIRVHSRSFVAQTGVLSPRPQDLVEVLRKTLHGV